MFGADWAGAELQARSSNKMGKEKVRLDSSRKRCADEIFLPSVEQLINPTLTSVVDSH